MNSSPKYSTGQSVQMVTLGGVVMLSQTTVASIKLCTGTVDMDSGEITYGKGWAYLLDPYPAAGNIYVDEANIRPRPEPGSMDTLKMICAWKPGVEV